MGDSQLFIMLLPQLQTARNWASQFWRGLRQGYASTEEHDST